MGEKVDVKWKYAAIIIAILFVIETGIFLWLMKLGTDSINNEQICSTNICINTYQAETYYYDSYSHMCTCFVNHEITHSEVMQ